MMDVGLDAVGGADDDVSDSKVAVLSKPNSGWCRHGG